MEEELKSADVKISEDARRQTTEKLAKEVQDLKRMSADMDEELKKKEVVKIQLTHKINLHILRQRKRKFLSIQWAAIRKINNQYALIG